MENNNLRLLANRKFQHVNFVGSKTLWSFNEKGDKVNVKAGWLGINTVNSTIDVECLGDGKFVGRGFISQRFTLKGNTIISGPVVLVEVF